jgi:hypothetical protein
VKTARVVVATTPGLAEILQHDGVRAARFYVGFGITEELFRRGVPADSVGELAGAPDPLLSGGL